MPRDPLELARRWERLDRLRERLEALHPDARSAVFGEGDPLASLALVGEAPGAEEEIAGRPFVGPAGHLLSRLLSEVTLKRESLWITNTVKRRPTREVANHLRNRAPTRAEIQTDLPILLAELEAIRPRAVVCLGNQAANALIHREFRMREEHGRWFSHPLGFQITATYHPAFLLRRQGADRTELEEAVRQDLAAAKAMAEGDQGSG